MLGIIFFFKQKTAYEMRISDWSSDVCSSDLLVAERESQALAEQQGDDRAHGRTELDEHAAGDHREHDLQRDRDPRDGLGVDVLLVLAVDGAAEGGPRRRDDRDSKLGAGDVDPDRGGRKSVV